MFYTMWYRTDRYLLAEAVFNCEFVICLEAGECFKQFDFLFDQQLIDGGQVLKTRWTILFDVDLFTSLKFLSLRIE